MEKNTNKGHNNGGYYNTGNFNAGNYNTGDYNTGSCNNGCYNIGCFNNGQGNLGDFNFTSMAFGCFNTEPYFPIWLFNKPSCWTLEDWMFSDANTILLDMPKDPAFRQAWWNVELTEEQTETVKMIPNFDPDIFELTTGINPTKG